MAKGTKKPGRLYSADRLIRQMSMTLIRDFRNNLNEPSFCSKYLSILREGTVAELRETVPAPEDGMSVAEYKSTYQIQSLFKRYRFEKDLYSEKELIEKAVTSFLETQTRIENIRWDKLDATTSLVLDVASVYVSNILGTYSDEEHRSLCRFGRRASVGIPARKASLAERWEIPMTGSSDQISWFDSEMSQDMHVQDYWARMKGSDPTRSTYRETRSLKLTLVPKTFKSLRAIMPNTTIGSYMSYGLGEMMRKRLKSAGYDIRRLQERHKYLAQCASVHGLHVTADLSSASDSISVALVERLLPRDWYEILCQSRIGCVRLPDGSIVESSTFSTMGVGFTFPLQTLVFLALLKAIQAVFYPAKDRRLISVYGDDMIYATRMHHHVLELFSKIGFVINNDKTYHEGHFRESCGGDYYHGVDVRPFQPRNDSAFLGKPAYEAMLYKYINTLRVRWTEHEIGETLLYLRSELEALGAIKLVPDSFPDDAGVKVSSPRPGDLFLVGARVTQPKHKGHGVFQFPFLRFIPEERKEKRHGPYYWAALRGWRLDDTPYWVSQHANRPRPPRTLRILEEVTGLAGKSDRPALIIRDDHPIKLFRGINGERQRRNSTYTTISGSGRYQRHYGTSCFE